MNPNEEYEMYTVSDQALRAVPNLFSQRQVLHTRMLKLPSVYSDSGYPVIGFTLFSLGQYQKCILPLKRTIIANPTNTKARITLAKAFLNLKKEDQCFSLIKKSIILSLGESELHRFIINTFEELNRLDKLSAFYKDIEGMLTDVRSIPILYCEIAEALVCCKKPSQAFEFYKKAIETNSTPSLKFHSQYALALYNEGIFEEAMIQFEKIKSLDPTNKLACNNLAYLHYMLGNIQKALNALEYIKKNCLETIETYSNNLLVLYHLDEEEKMIKKFQDLLKPYTMGYGFLLIEIYEEALMTTQMALEKDKIDDESREFNSRKFHALNQVLSFLKTNVDQILI